YESTSCGVFWSVHFAFSSCHCARSAAGATTAYGFPADSAAARPDLVFPDPRPCMSSIRGSEPVTRSTTRSWYGWSGGTSVRSAESLAGMGRSLGELLDRRIRPALVCKGDRPDRSTASILALLHDLVRHGLCRHFARRAGVLDDPEVLPAGIAVRVRNAD